MDQQERQVISDIFRRLEQVADQPREPEAERFIADKVRQQPYAPYAMAQAIYVQEQALASLQAELEQLRAEADQSRRQPQQGGFLSSLFGGNARPEPARPEPARPEPARLDPAYRDPSSAASPWGQGRGAAPGYGAGMQGGPMQGNPMQGGPMQGGPWGGGNPMQSRGGGFLQGALSTAAGVAGGVMIANALSHAFGGGADEAVKGAAEGASNLSDQATGLTDLGQSNDNAGISDALYDNPQAGDDYSDLDSGSGDDGDWT